MTQDELEARVAALEAREAVSTAAPPGPPVIEPQALYTVKEAAVRLRCQAANLYMLVESQTLASIRVGAGRGAIRILGSDLLTFLSSRRVGGPQTKMALKRLGL